MVKRKNCSYLIHRADLGQPLAVLAFSKDAEAKCKIFANKGQMIAVKTCIAKCVHARQKMKRKNFVLWVALD